jgi:OmpA-OmpF porin, OOP family
LSVLPRANVGAIITCAAVIALALTGCSSSSTSASGSTSATTASFGCVLPKAPLAMAIGDRANSANPSPELSGGVSGLLNTVAGAGQGITLIRIDGSPQVYYQQAFTSTADNSGAKQTDLNTYLTTLGNSIVRHAKAVVPQVNLLAAMTKAGQATAPGDDVVLIDSGLQTIAPLDFRQGDLIDASPQDVVRFLHQQQLLPPLAGRHVLLIGFGDTSAPQPSLDYPQQQNVIAIWTAIAKAGGASCVAVDTTPDDQPAVRGLPTVGVVPIPKPPTIRGCGETILNADNHVNFVANQATFIDLAAARSTLAKLADKLRNGEQKVELIGTTATAGTPAGRIRLSEQRAEAVKRVLVSLGIAASRITTKGVGTNWPGHVPDLGPGGVLLPGPAAENREVIAKLTCPTG